MIKGLTGLKRFSWAFGLSRFLYEYDAASTLVKAMFRNKNTLDQSITEQVESQKAQVEAHVKKYGIGKEHAQFQAINNPNKSLAGLSEVEQDRILVELTNTIEVYLMREE